MIFFELKYLFSNRFLCVHAATFYNYCFFILNVRVDINNYYSYNIEDIKITIDFDADGYWNEYTTNQRGCYTTVSCDCSNK